MGENIKKSLRVLGYVVVALLFYVHGTGDAHGNVTVGTTDGPVLGYSLNISDHQVVTSPVEGLNIFLGIPYAEPPVGDLRFARPVPKKSWKPNVLSATKVSPACPQNLFFMKNLSFGQDFNNSNEDCLYLNIYAPTTSKRPLQHYPVMIWIHGGAYRYGSGAEYDGRVLAQEGVVVVTINYRLGVLGFLSTDDDAAPGNYALLDQALAINWTKNNIYNFGGDPSRITIFGESAGGASVSLQMFSPLTKGLFQAVIPQSGCALSPWAIYRPPHNSNTYSKILAEKVGCINSSSADMVHCLRGVSADLLVLTSTGAPPMISAWAPRVDGYFIKDLPEVLLEKGDFDKDVAVMTGYVSQEIAADLGMTVPGIANGLTRRQLEKLFHDKSRRYLEKADEMKRALICAYPPSDDVLKNRENAINMVSDYEMVAPHMKMAEKLSLLGVKVWLYEFAYRSGNSTHPEWMGVPHAEELYYEFGSPFFANTPCPGPREATCPVTWQNYQPWSQTDGQVSRSTMAIWTAFAKQGFQSGDIRVQQPPLLWPSFRPGDVFLNISDTAYTTSLIRTKGLQFWDSYNYLNLSSPIPHLCQSSIVG